MMDQHEKSVYSSCATCPVRKKSLFAGLSKVEIASLSTTKSHRLYRKGEIVFHQGEETTGIFCIGAGSVKVSQKSRGKTTLVRLAGKGDSVGHRSVFTSKTFRGEAIASEGTHLCFVSRQALLLLLDTSVGFSLRLIQRMSRDLEFNENLQRAQRTKTLDERMAELLLKLREEHGERESRAGAILAAPLSRRDLATILGVADESVIRTLSGFRKKGWIAAGTKLCLLDVRALARLAGRKN